MAGGRTVVPDALWPDAGGEVGAPGISPYRKRLGYMERRFSLKNRKKRTFPVPLANNCLTIAVASVSKFFLEQEQEL